MVRNLSPGENTPADQPTPDLAGVALPPCDTFIYEFGAGTTDPEEMLALAKHRDFPEIAIEVAHVAIERERLSAQEYRAARCAKCILRNSIRNDNGCPSESELLIQEEEEQAEQQMAMFDTGPVPITILRVRRAGMTMREFDTLRSNEAAMATALQNNVFTIEKLLGGIQNEIADDLHIKELPDELQGLTFTKYADTFETHRLTFGEGSQPVLFTDVSSYSGFTGQRLSEQAFGILMGKVANFMEALSKNGPSAALDANLLKIIRHVKGGIVAEARMTGKNRMYVAILGNRVIMIGSHGHADGGDVQQSFIKASGLAWV